MIDTTEIYKTFFRKSYFDGAIDRGCRVESYSKNGSPKSLVFKEKGESSPFIRLVNTNDSTFYLRANLSFPRWLFGSNLHLPVGRDIRDGFNLLSEYVGDHTGIKFDAKLEKVRRIDYTKDRKVGSEKAKLLINHYKTFSIPRYRRVIVDSSTVYFHNKGRQKNSKYCVYEKGLERKNKKGTSNEIEMADGIIRFERSLKCDAVNRLTKSLGIPNEARGLLRDSVALPILNNVEKILQVEELLNAPAISMEEAIFTSESNNPFALYGYSKLKAKYGDNIEDLPFVDSNIRTIQRYERALREIQVIS